MKEVLIMNSVELIVSLKEKVDSFFRKVEYELPSFNENGKNTASILVKYWPSQPNSRLIELDGNRLVAIRGHLDTHEKFGTIVVVEQFKVIK